MQSNGKGKKNGVAMLIFLLKKTVFLFLFFF